MTRVLTDIDVQFTSQATRKFIREQHDATEGGESGQPSGGRMKDAARQMASVHGGAGGEVGKNQAIADHPNMQVPSAEPGSNASNFHVDQPGSGAQSTLSDSSGGPQGGKVAGSEDAANTASTQQSQGGDGEQNFFLRQTFFNVEIRQLKAATRDFAVRGPLR